MFSREGLSVRLSTFLNSTHDTRMAFESMPELGKTENNTADSLLGYFKVDKHIVP